MRRYVVLPTHLYSQNYGGETLRNLYATLLTDVHHANQNEELLGRNRTVQPIAVAERHTTRSYAENSTSLYPQKFMPRIPTRSHSDEAEQFDPPKSTTQNTAGSYIEGSHTKNTHTHTSITLTIWL